jgi:hypothetical protein
MLKREKLVALAVASILAVPAIGASQVATPMMVGRWEGEGNIVVDWTKQRTIAVNIVIFADDKVTGTVGDATLVNGRLLRNRGWLSSMMHWKTDYIIEATLEGPIIRAENIERANVYMPLNWRDGRLEGGINTSGAKSGGTERAVLTAKVMLHRAPEMIICDAASPRCVPRSFP